MLLVNTSFSMQCSNNTSYHKKGWKGRASIQNSLNACVNLPINKKAISIKYQKQKVGESISGFSYINFGYKNSGRKQQG